MAADLPVAPASAASGSPFAAPNPAREFTPYTLPLYPCALHVERSAS